MRNRFRALTIFGVSMFAIACARSNTSTVDNQASALSNRGLAIMPLGDSITYGAGDDENPDHGGYRPPLYDQLQFSFHFVGSQLNGPATLADHRHEGHPGYTIDQIHANIDGWLSAATPDIILLHIGTNDLANNVDVNNAPARLQTLLTRIFQDLPNVTVFVSQIVPLRPGTNSDQQVIQYNQGVASTVAGFRALGASIYLVDLHTGMESSDLSQDQEHPLSRGYVKMAARLATAINSVINGNTAPSPTPEI